MFKLCVFFTRYVLLDWCILTVCIWGLLNTSCQFVKFKLYDFSYNLMYYIALPHLLCESLMSVVECNGGHGVLLAALATCIASQLAVILVKLLAARCSAVCSVALSCSIAVLSVAKKVAATNEQHP